MAKNEEGISELRQLWTSRIDNLEKIIQSSGCDNSKIVKEMKKLEGALSLKLLDLEITFDNTRMLEDLGLIRAELISANEGRLRGDVESDKLMMEMLKGMKGALLH